MEKTDSDQEINIKEIDETHQKEISETHDNPVIFKIN